jgi:dTDP-4-amino-4,6-dideoxygalactose transaminase
MDAVLHIADSNGLAVIEDACQAWGAAWQGRRVGALGDVGVFSFQASKNLTAGEGGIVITSDEYLADQIWSLHNVGRMRTGQWYEHVQSGWNYRMTEWQGAVLLAQLARFQEQTRRRDRNARYLRAQLEAVRGIAPLALHPGVTQHAWHLLILRYDGTAFGGMARDAFVDALQAEGIPCQSGYLPLNQSKAVVDALRALGRQPDPCPINDRVCAHESVWLPQNLLLGTEADMDSIVAAIEKIQWAKEAEP